MALASKVINQAGAIREFEKPEVCEAIEVANVNKWTVSLSPMEWHEREARLKKEYGKNHIKGDFSGNKSIEHCGEPGPGEEQPKENSLKAATDAFILQANEIMRLKKKNAELLEAIDKMKEGNPALKESASQFNDALLDEQAKKIDEQNHELTRLISLVEKKENSIRRLYYEKSVLEKENEELKKGEIPARYFDKALVDEQAEKIKKLEHEKLDILEMASSCKQTIAEQADKIKRLGKEISKLNGIIHKKNLKIEELRKESSRHLRGKIKMFGENMDLEQMLKDKNAVLSDVAEELRLTKIREKNLAELGLKYVGENEKLKKELADKVVDKIDAQALKSAESALAWKEKVIAEKDEVIEELKEKLKSINMNRHNERIYKKQLAEKDEVIADLGNELAAFKESYKRRIKEDSEHFEHIQKICNAGLQKWLIESEYLEKDKPFRFPQQPELSEEELMKLQEKVCADIIADDAFEKWLLYGKIIIKSEK